MAREMKNSGVQWIGEIPSNWNTIQLKRHSHVVSGKEVKVELEPEDENAVPVYGSGGVFKYTDREQYNGEVVMFGRKGTIGKPLYVNDSFWAVDTMYFLIHERAYLFPKFNYYQLSAFNWELYTTQTALPSIVASQILDSKFPFPPLAEQKAIADFLDAKCGEIDGLLADLDAEVKTLTEYKKSIIAETVTRGLNPNAPMKQVALGWIDELPANWSVARIASVYSVRNEKVSDQDYQPLSVTMKGIVPQLENAAKTKHGDDRKLIRKGDFVINSRSDRRGSCGISPYDGSCSLINTVLAPREEMNPRYYNWLFHTTQFADEFYKWGYGIVDDLWTTNWGAMRRIQIPVPSLEEQEEIAAYLDVKVPKIDETISLKQDQIETLKAYKSSLIYEYVTGKKQVAL